LPYVSCSALHPSPCAHLTITHTQASARRKFLLADQAQKKHVHSILFDRKQDCGMKR
jgi:hypothetical protein